MSKLVFVYGTLLMGMRNHRVLNGAEFKGHATTVDKFSMFAHSGYPAITLAKRYQIKGEVYEVTPEIMKRLDYLEGHTPGDETSLYQRKIINVKDNHDRVLEAWVYYQDVDTPRSMRLLKAGDYREIADSLS